MRRNVCRKLVHAGCFAPNPCCVHARHSKTPPEGLTVLVDHQVPVENLTRFGENSGYAVAVARQDGDFTVTFSK